MTLVIYNLAEANLAIKASNFLNGII